MESPKLEVKPFSIAKLLQDVEYGAIRIPLFQRDFVWDKIKVMKLLNSIYEEFPIGSFFFWEADPKYKDLYRDIPEFNVKKSKNNSNFLLILDGQQRITSLYIAIKDLTIKIKDRKLNNVPINFSDISFDLGREKFVVKKPDNKSLVSLKSILGPNHIEVYDSLEPALKEKFNKCMRVFNNYSLSGVYVYEQDLENACEIFQRINQQGKPLTIFDLVVAKTWSEKFNLKDEIATVNDKLRIDGFGGLEPELIVQALDLMKGGNGSKSSLLNLTTSDISNYWKDTSDNLQLAISYLKNELGVVNLQILPHRIIISLLTYFFFKIRNRSFSPDQNTFINQWFWKSVFSQHYIHSQSIKMNEDKKMFDKFLSGENIDIDKEGKDYEVRLTTDELISIRIGGKKAFHRNAILCLLAQLGPLHFKNGTKIPLNDNVSNFLTTDLHHIFPKSYLKKTNNTYNENSIVNRCIITSELNKSISDTPPSKYFKKFSEGNPKFDEILVSHLIPFGKGSAVEKNQFDKFLQDRASLIYKEIEKRVGHISTLENDLAEDPIKVIDDIEFNIKVIVDTNLSEKFGEKYWKTSIPSDIQDNVRKRVEQNKKKHPEFKIQSDADMLDFCDLDDFRKIIQKNWELFESEFKSKVDFEVNYVYFIEYRNQLKHGRKDDSSKNKHGQASIEWFASLIKELAKSKSEEELGNQLEIVDES